MNDQTMPIELPSRRHPTLRFLSGVYPLPVEPERGPTPPLHAFGRTHRGHARSVNEDQFLIAQTERVVKVDRSSLGLDNGAAWPVDRRARILMVADGIGGLAHGDIASAVAVDSILGALGLLFGVDEPGDEEIERALEAAIEHAQQRIFSVARSKALHLEPGTTLTMAYVHWPTMYVAHVGDSRCYLLRDGALRQLTQDHTLAARLVDAGMAPDQAAVMGSRHTLTNAVGGSSDRLYVDLHRHRLVSGDRVLLCTDGLHDFVAADRIESVLRDGADFMQATTELVDEALAAGTTDNVTAVVMQVS